MNWREAWKAAALTLGLKVPETTEAEGFSPAMKIVEQAEENAANNLLGALGYEDLEYVSKKVPE